MTAYDLIKKDKLLNKTISREFYSLQAYYPTSSSIIKELNLEEYYRRCEINYNYARYYDEKGMFIQILDKEFVKEDKLVYLMKLSHLSTIAIDNPDDILKIFQFYFSTLRPKFHYLADKFLLNEKKEEVPF